MYNINFGSVIACFRNLSAMCYSLATAASGMFWGTVQCTRWPYPVSSSVVLVAWEWRLVSYCSCTEDVTSVKYRCLAKEQKVSCKVKDVCSFTFNSLYIHVCKSYVHMSPKIGTCIHAEGHIMVCGVYSATYHSPKSRSQ